MRFYIFMDVIKDTELKHKFVLSSKYYNEHPIFNS